MANGFPRPWRQSTRDTKMNVINEEALYIALEIFSDIEPNTRKLSK